MESTVKKDLVLIVTRNAVSSSNPYIGALMFSDGEVSFEVGKYTEKEAVDLNNAKELASLERSLTHHFCGKFEVKETESCWEVYGVNADDTMLKWYELPKAKDGLRFIHYVRIFAEEIEGMYPPYPYDSIDKITQVVRECNDSLTEFFFLKPCYADDGKRGIEIAMTREYGVNFNLE